MLYHITTVEGVTHSLDLPVEDSITWHDFENLSEVKQLGKILDVTPDGMPKWFSDEEQMTRQLHNLGIKRTRNEQGISQYSEEDEAS